MLSTILT